MKIVFVFTAPPHAGIDAQEGLDALLMGSAFTECAAVFMGSAVWQLVKDQSPEAIGHKNFTKAFAALRDYGVQEIICDERPLDAAGINADDLCIEVSLGSPAAIRELIGQADRVLTF